MDEAILRFFTVPFDRVFQDEVAKKMIASCQKHNIPITVNKYVWEPKQLRQQVNSVLQDDRFSGFILYETANYIKFGPMQDCPLTMEQIRTLKIP